MDGIDNNRHLIKLKKKEVFFKQLIFFTENTVKFFVCFNNS